MPSNPVRVTLIDSSEVPPAVWDKIRDLHLNHGLMIADLVKRFSGGYGISRNRISTFIRQCRETAGLPPASHIRKSEFGSSEIRSNPKLKMSGFGRRPHIKLENAQ